MSEISEYLAEIGRRGGKKSKGGGRPPKYQTEAERKDARKKQQKAYRDRLRAKTKGGKGE